MKKLLTFAFATLSTLGLAACERNEVDNDALYETGEEGTFGEGAEEEGQYYESDEPALDEPGVEDEFGYEDVDDAEAAGDESLDNLNE